MARGKFCLRLARAVGKCVLQGQAKPGTKSVTASLLRLLSEEPYVRSYDQPSIGPSEAALYPLVQEADLPEKLSVSD